MGFRPKETQSWTEDGCGLPKRCCQGRGGEKCQLYHTIIIQNKCKRKQKSQIPLILLKTLNSVTTNAHYATLAVSEQLGLYRYILDTWSAVDVATPGTTSKERTKIEGRTWAWGGGRGCQSLSREWKGEGLCDEAGETSWMEHTAPKPPEGEVRHTPDMHIKHPLPLSTISRSQGSPSHRAFIFTNSWGSCHWFYLSVF